MAEHVQVEVQQQRPQDFTGATRHRRKGRYDPNEPYSGKVVQGPDKLPGNGEWQAIQFDNRWELWPVPPEEFDPSEGEKLLRQVDAAYLRTKPTPDHPTLKPVRMLVNDHFKKLFPNVRYWGEEPDVPVERESDPSVMPQTFPAFRFICEEKLQDPGMQQAAGVEIRTVRQATEEGSFSEVQQALDEQSWQPSTPTEAAAPPAPPLADTPKAPE